MAIGGANRLLTSGDVADRIEAKRPSTYIKPIKPMPPVPVEVRKQIAAILECPVDINGIGIEQRAAS